MNRVRILFRYLWFLLKARSVYRIHSPFVYRLCTEVLLKSINNQSDAGFRLAGRMRAQIFSDRKSVQMNDVGAGSHFRKKMTLGRRARSLSMSRKETHILYKLVKKFRPRHIIELGTGAGVSALYMAAADRNTNVESIEGNPVMVQLAQQAVSKSGLQNITIYEGLFDNVLPGLLKNTAEVDLIFIDGDHKSTSLFRYYEMIKPYLKENSILVLHDIYWSADMMKAWKALSLMPEVTFSVDIFHLGLLFFRRGGSGEHFRIRV